MKKVLLSMAVALCATCQVFAEDFQITSIDPAAGSKVAGIAKGSYVKFSTNMDDQVKGVTYTFSDKTTGEVLYTTFSTAYVAANQQWEIKNYSNAVTDFKKGHEIEYKIEAYDEARPSSTKIGEDAITWIGDGTEDYTYSTATVLSVIPEAGTTLKNTSDTDFVITYSAPVEIDTQKSVIVTGQMSTAAYESITSNEDKTVWTLKVAESLIAKTTPQLYLNVYVKDAEGKGLEGNTSGAYKLEDMSYYKYKYVCYFGSPDMTVSPAEGEVASLKEFSFTYEDGANFSYAADGPAQVLDANGNAVAELPVGATNFKRSGNNTMVLTLENEITAPGTYTVVIPNAAFALGTEFNAYTSKEQRFTYTIPAPELQVVEVNPATGSELTNMPEKFTVTFSDPSLVGYGKWRVVNLSKDETDDNYVLTQGQLKQTDGVWGGKAYFVEALKMYQGSDYQLEVYPYTSVEDDQTEAEFGSNAISKLIAATWKGAKEAYQFAAAKLDVLTPASESTIVSGEITAVFTAPVETLRADINGGVGGNNAECQATPSEDKMTWTIVIPQGLIDTATGGLTMNVYAYDADGKTVEGNVGEDAESYFVWEFNCYNGCPLPKTITPATGSVVEKIDEIYIEEPSGISYAYALCGKITVTKGQQFICTIPHENVTYSGTGTKQTKAKVTLPTPITAPGTYQIIFPTQYFMIGEEFSSAVSQGFVLEYTIEGEEEDPTPAPAVTVKTAKPSYMELTFAQVTAPSWNATATVVNAKGETVAENCAGDYGDDWDDWNTVKISFGTDLTPGKYTVNIPEGMFVFGENGDSQNEAMTVEFTIEGTTAITTASAGNSNIIRYTVSGLKAGDNAKGIIIVNGKKVIR